jgi:hypothetical protein
VASSGDAVELDNPGINAFSTVSRFGRSYRPLLPNLSAGEEVEALIEGSEISLVRMRNQTIPNSVSRHTSNSHSHSERYQNRDSATGSGDTHVKPEITLREWISTLYTARPSRLQRFLGDSEERGGTVVVHYIKKDEWFAETWLALLGSSDGERVEQVAVGGMDDQRERGHVGGEGLALNRVHGL